MAVKEALDLLSDKTAWLRWLKEHVHYSADTAQRYMQVARFAEKNRSASVFFGLDPTVLGTKGAVDRRLEGGRAGGDRTVAPHRAEMAGLGYPRHQEEAHAMRT